MVTHPDAVFAALAAERRVAWQRAERLAPHYADLPRPARAETVVAATPVAALAPIAARIRAASGTVSRLNALVHARGA